MGIIVVAMPDSASSPGGFDSLAKVFTGFSLNPNISRVLAGVFLIVVSLVVVFFGQPRFLMNDDWIIRAFADGSFSGRQEVELVFVGKLHGLLLNIFYTIFPFQPWYEIGLLATNILAFLLLFNLVGGSPLGRFAWLLATLSVFVWLVQAPNFTSTAIVAAGLGAVALVVRLVKRNFGWPKLLFPSSVFLLGISWRFDAIWPAFLTALFLLVGVYISTAQAGRKVLLIMAGFSTIFGGLVGVTYALNSSCFERNEAECAAWSEWNHFNSIRGSLHDSPRGELLREEVRSGNLDVWTASETEQFLKFMYFDEAVHERKALTAIDERIPKLPFAVLSSSGTSSLDAFAERLKDLFSALDRNRLTIYAWVGLTLALLSPAMLQDSSRRTRVFLGIATVALGPAISMFSAALIRLPDRVALPLIGLWMISTIILFASIGKEGQKLRQPSSIAVLEGKTRVAVGLTAGALLLLFLSPRYLVIGMTLIAIGYIFREGIVRLIKYVPLSKTGLAGVFLLLALALPTLFAPLGFLTGKPSWSIPGQTIDTIRVELSGHPSPEPVLFLPGESMRGAVISHPYSMGPSLSGNMLPSSWATFSPHWDKRLALLGVGEVSFDKFATGKVLWVSEGHFCERSSLLAELEACGSQWISLGTLSPESSLEIWKISESSTFG